jgi:mono/diheme cytochrome c family protein
MSPSALRRGVAVICVTAGFSAAAVAQMSTTPIPDGKALYTAKCATCHGALGMGDGPAGALLRVPPRDFTRGIYKFRSTSSGSLPTDEDLMRVVADGIPGTSMIGWKDLLSDAERQAVVARVKAFSARFTTETPRPVSLAPEVPLSPASLEAGRQVYASLQCGACHGESGRVDTAVASALQDDWGHTVTVARLTEPWTFKGGSSARALALHIKTGIDGTPMPGVADLATDTDLWNLAHYVRSLARKPVWEMNADELKSHYSQVDVANSSPRHARIATPPSTKRAASSPEWRSPAASA